MLEDILDKMSTNLDKNYKIIKKKYKNITAAFDKCYVAEPSHNDYRLLLLLKTLFKYGENPNKLFIPLMRNYILGFIRRGFSEDFIIQALKIGLEYGLDINCRDRYGTNILTMFFEDNCEYVGNITNIYNILIDNNFDIFMIDNNYNSIKNIVNNSNSNISDYSKFIAKFNEDIQSKKEKKIKEVYKVIESKTNENKLYYLVKETIDEDITYEIIKYLLEKGIDPNIIITSDDNRVFIEAAMVYNHSLDFIFKITKLAIKHGLDINRVNGYGQTILHVFVEDKIHIKNVGPIYRLLKDNNFDFNIKDCAGKTVNDIIINSNTILDKELVLKEARIDKFNKTINEEDIKYLENISTQRKTYNYKVNYNQIDSDLYYFSNSILLLVGKPGIGKTSLLDYFKFKIYDDYKNKGFITSINDIMKSQPSIGGFKNQFLMILKKCVDNNIILFIDDFDDIYKLSELDREQIQIMIKYYIDNYGLRIIGSINKENYQKINKDILSEYTNYHTLKELNSWELIDLIYDEIFKKLSWFDFKYDDITSEALLDLLLELSNNEHEVSILKIIDSIIEDIHECSVKNNKIINKDIVIYAIKRCNYIEDNEKSIIIDKLINLTEEEEIKHIKKLSK